MLKKVYVLPHVYSNFRRSLNVAIQDVDDIYLVSLKRIILDYICFCLCRIFTYSLVLLGKISL